MRCNAHGGGRRITIQMSYNVAISIHKEILEPWQSVVQKSKLSARWQSQRLMEHQVHNGDQTGEYSFTMVFDWGCACGVLAPPTKKERYCEAEKGTLLQFCHETLSRLENFDLEKRWLRGVGQNPIELWLIKQVNREQLVISSLLY